MLAQQKEEKKKKKKKSCAFFATLLNRPRKEDKEKKDTSAVAIVSNKTVLALSLGAIFRSHSALYLKIGLDLVYASVIV